MSSVVGRKVPEISVEVSGGQDLVLPQDFSGKWTLVYLYPKDDTPGCTKQACGYRDNIGQFTQIGVQVYGLSLDDLASHDAFQEKYSLNFPLIYDKNKQLSTFFGSYGEQEWNGKKYNGLSRDTFLIDPDGVVRKEWRKVDATSTVNTTFTETKSLVL